MDKQTNNQIKLINQSKSIKQPVNPCALILSETLALYKSFTFIYIYFSVV